MAISNAEFTTDDRAYGEAYVSNRALLFELWNLASMYPNIASKIHIRIRRADPTNDYYYEPSFADAAIVVSLSWFDEQTACDFLSCNDIYPRGRRCRFTDAPKIFPSGDHTTLTACEPSCYIVRAARNKIIEKYYDSAEFDMMLKNGNYVTRNREISILSHERRDRKDTAPDLPNMEYSRFTNRCELANIGLLTFVTQPYERSVKHNVCRQDNFVIGDDLVKSNLGYRSGRHSRTYCNAFYKTFDPVSRSCEESLTDTILSYTFIGNAILRLARHAIYGEGCTDSLFEADQNRAETNEDSIARVRRSRRDWYADVNRTWSLPPPNVLLSDLGISPDAPYTLVWSNRNGGTLENVSFNDRLSEREHSLDARSIARRKLQQSHDNVSATSNVRLPSTVPIDTSSSSPSPSPSSSSLDFDKIYEALSSKTDNEVFHELIREIGKEVGYTSAMIVTEILSSKLMRKMFNRTLRYVGQRFAGQTSARLVSLGVRVTTSRMIGLVLSRLTTRLMLILATTASGVGTIIGIVELISFLLDILILVGWDPGNYNAEFDNAVYDDLVQAWRQQKTFQESIRIDPYVILAVVF